MRAELLSICTTLPEHRVTASDTKRQVAATVPPSAAARFAQMVDISGNETRYLVLPLDDLRRLDTLEARNQAYRQHALRLGEAVARQALREAAVAPDAITAIVGVSSTGHLVPTLETYLLDRLQLSRHCRRVPLTGLGCAGGAAGVSLGAALADGAPSSRVLVVSVELPSLSFPTAEPSPTDILASTQFGDSAAAAVISGDRWRGPAVVGTGSVVFPGTLNHSEVQLTPYGLRLRPPRGLGELLRRNLGAEVDAFLARHDRRRGEMAFWVIHPRNRELLDAAAAGLQLSESALAQSRAVWRRTGNVISSAVFHVLAELRDSAPPPDGALGLMIAFGAGFSCEMVLLQAGGWLCQEKTRYLA
jgi:alkylresorcinol/alkylpyrone synthase